MTGTIPCLSGILALILAQVTTGQQPNIIFLLSDDQGYYDVGYNTRTVLTPNIDSLAKGGIILSNYYTCPTCTPTRTQLLTGRYQIHTGMQHGPLMRGQDMGLPLDEVTLANKFKDMGYATHMIGKWHLGNSKSAYMPHYRGFDSFLGFLGGAIDYYTHTYNFFRTPYLDFRDENGPRPDLDGEYSAFIYDRRAMEILDNHDQTQGPVFLYYAHQLPHYPVQAPDEYKTAYGSVVDEDRKTYLGMVAALDESVRQLEAKLKSNGMWNNTLIVFASDNGGSPENGASNYPLRGEKNSLFEGGIQGLAFVAGGYLLNNLGSGVEAGQVNSEMMHVSDWFPTLVTAAGGDLSGSKPLDGLNQWDTITKGSASPRNEFLIALDELKPQVGEPAYADTFDTRIKSALRAGDYKIITGYPGNGMWWAPKENTTLSDIASPDAEDKNLWLFNVVADPKEENDLSAVEVDKVKEMLGKLQAYLDDSVPVIYPDKSNRDSNPRNLGNVWGPWLD